MIYLPHSAAHKISLLNLFLYFLISGVSELTSCDVGVTLTLTCDSLLEGPDPALNPNVRKDRCFCCKARAFIGGVLPTFVLLGLAPLDGLIACRY